MQAQRRGRYVRLVDRCSCSRVRAAVRLGCWCIAWRGSYSRRRAIAPQSHPGGHIHQQGGGRDATRASSRLLDMPTRNLWIGTFHGLGPSAAAAVHCAGGWPTRRRSRFIDSDDQQRLIKRVLKNIGDGRERVRADAKFSGSSMHRKDEGLTLQCHLDDEGNDGPTPNDQRSMRAYEEACAKSGARRFW